MTGIHFQRTYLLGEAYESIRDRAVHMLEPYLGYPGLITFNESVKSVIFSSERLIPTASTNRPRVMLLFSNPHPHSIYQGMFLSPNTRKQENLFWPIMQAAGWLSVEGKPDPRQLAEICLNVEYEGPFELIFYCYFTFPTDYPEDIRRIFGRVYFDKFIEPEAMDEFRQTLQATAVEAVVTFNKTIFNRVAQDPVDRCVGRLKKGELIQSRIKDVDRRVPIFLTFPTGWRYRKDYRKLREENLVGIRRALQHEG